MTGRSGVTLSTIAMANFLLPVVRREASGLSQASAATPVRCSTFTQPVSWQGDSKFISHTMICMACSRILREHKEAAG